MSGESKQDKTKTAFRVSDARFVAAGQKLADLPETPHVEIAFAGRSNVGKSSLLNSLLQRRTLVRTSKTPGATRAINLFEAALAGGPHFTFADLPGYGYAQRSRSERASWGPMLEGYLRDRTALVALVILVDIRRGLEDDDVELAQFASSLERPLAVIVCATKLDKLALSKRKPAVISFGKKLSAAGVPSPKAIGYSAMTHEGRDALWERLVSFAHPAG